MDYNKIIHVKNKVVFSVIMTSIIVRAIVDVLLGAPPITVIAMVGCGIVVAVVGLILLRTSLYKPTMYFLTLSCTALCIVMMYTAPSWVNIIVFYYAIFVVCVYQSIAALSLQCALSSINLIIAYFVFKDTLFVGYGIDNLGFMLTYIGVAYFILSVMCHMTTQTYRELEESLSNSEHEKERVRSILDVVSNASGNLLSSSSGMLESIKATESSCERVNSFSVEIANKSSESLAEIQSVYSDVEVGEQLMESLSNTITNVLDECTDDGKLVKEGLQELDSLNTSISILDEKSELAFNNSKDLIGLCGEIQKIVSVISGINEQVKLLSLNASIEAARAGESGRGFSVVASEMKKLSDSAKESTGTIQDVLTEFETRAIVLNDSIVNVTKTLTSCCSNSDKLDTTLNMIGLKTDDCIQLSNTAKGMVSEVHSVFKNILDGVSSVAQTSDVNAKSTQEISDSIFEMSSEMESILDSYNRIDDVIQNLNDLN